VLSRTIAGSTVNLSWTNVTNETGYEVQRKKGGSWITLLPIKGRDVTTHSDSPGNGNYGYRVRALGPEGNSSWSNTVNSK